MLGCVSNSTDGSSQPSKKRRSGKKKKASPILHAFRVTTLIVALAAAAVLLIDPVSFADYADGTRTAQATTLSEAVRGWRRAAWQEDDFFSQIRLGDLYSQNQSFPRGDASKNPGFYDPIEAYVWYFMALRPNHRYSVNDNAAAMRSLYNIKSNALTSSDNLYNAMTFEQRLEARARIIYILQSRGAEGFFTLGRLHYYGVIDPGNGNHISEPQTPYMLVCWRSWWARDSIRRWFWSLWSSTEPDPHWRWVERTQDNYNSTEHLMPDDLACQRDTTIPPEPEENRRLAGGGNIGGGNVGGAIQLNNNNAAGNQNAGFNNLQGQDNVANGDDDAGDDAGNGGGMDLVMAPNAGGANQQQAIGNQGGGVVGGAGRGGGGGGRFSLWPVSSVFTPNDLEALVYFQRALILGHPIAGSYVNALKNNAFGGQRVSADAEKRAKYWTPPFEFYPGMTAGGLPHSDESVPSLEQRIALGRFREIPFRAVRDALAFRGLLKRFGCGPPPECFRQAVATFQSALGYEPTGSLTPPQVVRLIQMAAVDGNADSQDRLGIMYAKGIGVPQNYPRAEKWFMKAAIQRQGDALFNLYVLYKVGPNGIEHNEDKALSFFTQAAAIGRDPRARCELLDLLSQADGAGHDRPEGARR